MASRFLPVVLGLAGKTAATGFGRRGAACSGARPLLRAKCGFRKKSQGVSFSTPGLNRRLWVEFREDSETPR